MIQLLARVSHSLVPHAWVCPGVRSRSSRHSSKQTDMARPAKSSGGRSTTQRLGSSMNVKRKLDKDKTGAGKMRDRATIKRLKMYKAKPRHDKHGNFVSGDLMSRDTSHSTRIQPDRRWFGTFWVRALTGRACSRSGGKGSREDASH